MNSGIIRSALTTTLALEREYRETSIVREIGAESNQPTELQSPGRLFEDEFTCVLSVIEKAENF
jgi:hypothetical protein